MKKKIIYGILVICWMIVIFLFSNQDSTGSTNLTNGFLGKILEFINLEDSELIEYLFLPVRKLAHFVIYFILGILVINLFKEFNYSYKDLLTICIFICLIYSISDEIHQMYVPGRAGRVLDVCIDTCGSLLGIFGYLKLNKNSIKR